jgi:hypothetical protein
MHTTTKNLFISIAYLLSVQLIKAQDQPAHRAKAAYVEVLPLKGSGTLFTANFDTRFRKTQNGLGVRAGVGYIKSFIAGTTVYSPIGLNYLIGKKAPHYFETGATAINIFYSKYNNKKFQVGFLPTVGYRFQPLRNGFTFRIFTGVFIKNTSFLTAGASAGYKF